MSSDSDSQNREVSNSDEEITNPPSSPERTDEEGEVSSGEPQPQAAPVDKGKKAVDADHPLQQYYPPAGERTWPLMVPLPGAFW
jgi:hypothetical protein